VKKQLLIIAIIIVLCISTFMLTHNLTPVTGKDKPLAVEGVLDLSGWNWEQDGMVNLDGQWEFYWQELLTPQDFNTNNSNPNRNYIPIPSSWNKYTINGEALSGEGYATYRLQVNITGDQLLGLKLPRIFTAYNLWVNGELIASNGKVGTNRDQMVPQYLPQVEYFKPDTNTLDIVLQVSNYYHRSGGVLERLVLGSEAQISHLRTSNLALELFIFGCLFIIGFYHFALYIFRTRDKSTLYFGIYSVLIALRTLLVGERYLICLFPDFSWEIAHKIQTLAFYLGPPLIFLFLKSVFPNEVSGKANRFIQIFGFAFALLVLLTPARIFTLFNPIYQLFTLIVIPYVIIIVFSACLNKREGAYLIGVGATALSILALNDIAFLSIVFNDANSSFLRSIITRSNLSSCGLLIFVFAQALVLAQKYSKSFAKVESMTGELRLLNEGLEERVRERTQELETSKMELEIAYQAVSRLEKSRQQFLQNISHDLRTPLTSIQGYVEAILDGIVSEPEQQKKYLKRVIDRVSSINYMVQELTNLSQLESRQLKLNCRPVPLKSFIKNVTEKSSLDLRSANITFRTNDFTAGEDTANRIDQPQVMVDMEQIDRVFTNLFSNAIKYTPEEGSIDLNFALTSDRNELLIEVSDTGIGIPPEDLSHIFERFYKATKSRQANYKGKGLGLAIVKEIVEYHGGNIRVDSELGKGTRVFFTLPLHMIDNS
jgi:signal transduction histidine kinase